MITKHTPLRPQLPALGPGQLEAMFAMPPDSVLARGMPEVLLAGKLTAMAAPGGGEIQMLALGQALPELGVRARLWRPWEDSFKGVHCIHLFGSQPEHLAVVASAHRRGIPVVLSPIAWFALADCLRQKGSPPGRLIAAAKYAARAALPRLPSWRRKLYHAVDLLMPNSNAEARQLRRLFGVRAERIHVVPNGADPGLADADPRTFVRHFGVRDFVLYSGRIEPRKNQLRFLRAMRGTNVPIVVLGDAVPGHEDYFAKCRGAADGHVRFIPRLDHDDPLLASAYAACRCLVLAGWYETPGLAALEAGMSGAPLVLPCGGCAREYFGPDAVYVRPGARRQIRNAVLAARSRPRNPALADRLQRNFSWNAAAAATREGYLKVLR
ncbi:MAG: glycosyltransferase [Planctomycetes bacterium]|nr:glycosyltransferase [Planctomycetota bacterium]